jgi:signal peptidase I
MLYRASLTLGAFVGLYFATCGLFYLAGYRMLRYPTVAMHPTIVSNELVMGRLTEDYRNHVQRFDLVIYTVPEAPGEIYTKRVVGLPGEKIRISDQGVSINDKPLILPHAVNTDGFRLKQSNLVIPDDSIFVLGDNTEKSADSRYLGPVSLKQVVGYMVFKK